MTVVLRAGDVEVAGLYPGAARVRIPRRRVPAAPRSTRSANNSATLGSVRRHLCDAGNRWQFVLHDTDGDGSVEPLVVMLDRLWTGQVSRHGGGENSRDQTSEEARAAVHLTATLVQLLGSGALTRRSIS